MKKIFTTGILVYILLMIPMNYLGANELDSLFTLLDGAKKRQKPQLLLDIATYMVDSSIDLTKEYAEEVISLGKKNDDQAIISEAYIIIGMAYSQEYKDEEALDYFYKSLEIKEKHKVKEGMPKLLNTIGQTFTYISQLDSARHYHGKALNIATKLDEKREIANAYGSIGNLKRYDSDFDSALYYYEKALSIAEKAGEKGLIAKFNNNLGHVHSAKGNLEKSIEYYLKATEIDKLLGEKKGLAISYFNIGNAYNDLGSYEEANDFYQKSLKICQEIDFKRGIRSNYIGLASIYEIWAQNRRADSYPQAFEYYKKALKINEEINDVKEASNILNMIGNLFGKMLADYLELQLGLDWEEKVVNFDFSKTSLQDSAIYYYDKARILGEENNYKEGIANTVNNIGTIYLYTGKFQLAKENYQKALEINKEIQNATELPTNYRALGRVSLKENKLNEALGYFEKGLELSKKLGSKQHIQFFYEDISNTYKKMGEFDKALQNYRLYNAYKDSIFTESSQKIINQLQVQLGTAEKEKEIEKQKAQNALQKQQNQKQRIMIFAMVFVLFIIAVFVIFIFRQNNKIKKANAQLEEQNILISEQKKEITDSIHYASRIQRAILPPEDIIEKYIPESFILFKPRDIVSGDYYYITHKDSKTVIVAADCTGHGVPGAFMSMLGTAFLNEIVSQNEELHSDIMLNQLRSHVIKSLHQTGKSGESQDGMDLALYILDDNSNKIEYSGANNQLVLIRDGEIYETKADKMPIGIHVKADQPFTRHEIEVKKGDVLYTFSDGFQDQFGGEKGKKFMVKNMKRMFTEIYTKPMSEQRQIMDDAINDWMKDTHQIDDILVIGVRI